MDDRQLFIDDTLAINRLRTCKLNGIPDKDRPVTNDPDVVQQRMEALVERVSGLSAAMLRISGTLDLETVLQEVVDSARTLTGSAFGILATVDPEGRPEQFLSSGITEDQHRRLLTWARGPELFAHLRGGLGTVRVDDVPQFLRSLGFSTELVPFSTMQGTPINHRGVHVGSLFIADKEDGRQFTDADEELLVLFASQAATAIANARTYRDEQRARANLEALVETSPVGVVVFDAKTGLMVSLNAEAKRIVQGLHMPDRPLESVSEIITCRRVDGSVVSLAELPLAERLSSGQTLRNEEMVLSVPDGRSVKTLLNATPIAGAEGDIESVVVTLQDLAPFEELERMRTEFLAIVSHELRTPLTSIKGSTATVLAASPRFAPAEMLQFFRIIDGQADHMSGLIGDLLDAGRIATGTLSVSAEPSDVRALVDRARSSFLGGDHRHSVLVDLPPDLPAVMADRQRVVQILHNLLSNAASSAPESSPIQVSARRDGGHVAISVSDRGSGIPAAQLPHLFQKWAGAGDAPRGLGRGLGLAICKGLVEAHGGRIWATSGGEGQGARFTFTIPVAGQQVGDDPGPRDPRDVGAPVLGDGRRQVRILVVDDDPHTLRYVRDLLTASGYTALIADEHRELSRVIRAEKPDLVLLDLVLPGTDGIKLMEDVPELGDLPVIFISAYGRDETIARALGTGAADYIVKPFSPTELTARIRAVLRRRARPETFRLGALVVDYSRRRVTLNGNPVELTATEYEVLRLLSANAGRVLTYRSLLRQGWARYQGHVDPKLVHAVVKRLRRKLGEDGSQAAYILNERGVGYRMPGRRET